MAKVYGVPEDMPVPKMDDYLKEGGKFDFNAMMTAEDKYLEELAALAKSKHPGDLVGEVIRFGRGDGYAVYLVWQQRPLSLIHVPIGDAWRIEDFAERGIRISDVRQQVKSEKALNALFGKGKIA